MKISKAEFIRRRKQLMAMMDRQSIAIIPGAREVTRSRDTEYPFRQNSEIVIVEAGDQSQIKAQVVPLGQTSHQLQHQGQVGVKLWAATAG